MRRTGGGGIVEQPATPDPDLTLLAPPPTARLHGAIDARTTATLRARGQPGSNVRIALGRRPIVEPHPTIQIPRLVEVEEYVAAGQIGPDGTLDYEFKLLPGLSVGDAVIAQADLIPPGGGTVQRTNSIHSMVR